MEYKRYGDKVALRLDKGDEINDSIYKVAKAEKITAASISGIGATDDFTVGVFSLKNGKYDIFSFTENHEITALIGNITEVNGEPYIHTHITCAKFGGETVGGHLIKAVVSLTAEIVIDIISAKIDRYHDDALNINKWLLR